jgi:hypothetical protein
MSIGVFIDEKNSSGIHRANQSGAATDLVPDLGRKAQERRFGLIIVVMDRKVSIPLYESDIHGL